jgi:hypothetical protein
VFTLIFMPMPVSMSALAIFTAIFTAIFILILVFVTAIVRRTI